MSRSWKGGSTRAWRKTRDYVLERDRGLCRAHEDGWCARVKGTHTCTKRAAHAHHTLGRAVTGDDVRYIVASCRACNLFIGRPKPPPDDPPKPKHVSRW